MWSSVSVCKFNVGAVAFFRVIAYCQGRHRGLLLENERCLRNKSTVMSLYLYFVRESTVKIWGLTPRERIERILSDTAETIHDLSALGHNDHVLIFRADYLLDDWLVKYLATTPDIILYADKGRENGALAAYVPADMAQQTLKVLEGKNSKTLTGLNEQTLGTISVSFNQRLRKFEPPFVFHADKGGKMI